MFSAAFLLVLGAILAIISGAITGAITQWITHWINIGHERRSLAQAFAGEIGAILDIVDRRRYVQYLDLIIELVKTQQAVVPFKLTIRQNYFCVFESNIDRVGQLPGDLPREVARFYTYAKSIIEDVTSEGEIPNVEVCLHHLTELKSLFSELSETGPKLVDQLKTVRGPQLPRGLNWIPLPEYSGCDVAEKD